MEESDLLQAVGLLSVYDLGLVVSYMSMAHSEIAATEAGDELQMHRICSHSFAPPKPKLRKMKKPSDLGRRLRLTVQRLTAEMDTGRPSLLQDELRSEDGMGASFSLREEASADNAPKDVGLKPKELESVCDSESSGVPEDLPARLPAANSSCTLPDKRSSWV